VQDPSGFESPDMDMVTSPSYTPHQEFGDIDAEASSMAQPVEGDYFADPSADEGHQSELFEHSSDEEFGTTSAAASSPHLPTRDVGDGE